MSPDPLESMRLPIVPIQPRTEFAVALLQRISGMPASAERDVPTVRYFVDDIDAALGFYCDRLGFDLELRGGDAFAMLYRGELRLLLSTPGEPHRLPDGALPAPGGWNRISLRVGDLSHTVELLRGRGVTLRTPITSGPAVDTVLLEDPAGNLVELFEARGGYHERQEDP
jgi:catechol 2,3-dioxygenase-like lactoylglutathione lyase family enzyme